MAVFTISQTDFNRVVEGKLIYTPFFIPPNEIIVFFAPGVGIHRCRLYALVGDYAYFVPERRFRGLTYQRRLLKNFT